MREDKPLERVRRLLQGVELGDINTAPDLLTELDHLSPPLDQHAEHAVGEALKIVRQHYEAWVESWSAPGSSMARYTAITGKLS